MQYIRLNKEDYFQVMSKYTDRILSVVGLYLQNNEVIKYEIKGEGDWHVSRFNKIISGITEEDFYKLQHKVEELEDKINRTITIGSEKARMIIGCGRK